MQKLLLILLSGLYTLSAVAQHHQLHYTFWMDTAGVKPTLVVDLRFRGTDSGITYLHLPGEFAGQAQLQKAVTNFAIISKDVSLSTPADTTLRILKHKAGATIQIRYQLEQDWQGPLQTPNNNRAVINKEYLHATGFALLITPKLKDEEQVDVQLDWTRLPSGWNVANSFHTGTRKYRGRVRFAELRNTLYVAGDYRLYRTLMNKQPVYLAIRGREWQFADSAALKAMEKVMAVHRNFWNDHSDPYYLVTLTPLAGTKSYNGSALHRAFLACVTTEEALSGMFYWLLSHEYFHRWNGTVLQLAGDERQNTWFTEGFTEYYAYKLLHRAQLISLEEYVQKTNGILRDYYLSPVRNHDKVTLGRNFWSRREYQDMPYRKGFVYALYLDQRIATRSQGRYSLDTLMLAMRHQALAGHTLTDSSFISLLHNLTGEDATEQHLWYIDQGATIPVLAGSLGPQVSDSLQEFDAFDLGFDFGATAKSMVITGVVENSAAWRAGLRNGQKLKDGTVQFNNTTAPAVLRIETDGQVTDIKYQPVANERVAVRQFLVRSPSGTLQHQ